MRFNCSCRQRTKFHQLNSLFSFYSLYVVNASNSLLRVFRPRCSVDLETLFVANPLCALFICSQEGDLIRWNKCKSEFQTGTRALSTQLVQQVERPCSCVQSRKFVLQAAGLTESQNKRIRCESALWLQCIFAVPRRANIAVCGRARFVAKSLPAGVAGWTTRVRENLWRIKLVKTIGVCEMGRGRLVLEHLDLLKIFH